jgi:hypothetical protein
MSETRHIFKFLFPIKSCFSVYTEINSLIPSTLMPDDGFIKKPKHAARLGHQRELLKA